MTSSSGDGWFVLRPTLAGAARVTTTVEGTVSATSVIESEFMAEAAATRPIVPGGALWLEVAQNAEAVRVDVPAGGSTSVCVAP